MKILLKSHISIGTKFSPTNEKINLSDYKTYENPFLEQFLYKKFKHDNIITFIDNGENPEFIK